MATKIDRSSISDPDILACVDHVIGYIDACHQWESSLARQPIGLPETPLFDFQPIQAMMDIAGLSVVQDFDEAKEKFKPIVNYFWGTDEWRSEVASFGSSLKHDPDREWPINATRVSDFAIEVFTSVPDNLSTRSLVRAYRLDKSPDDVKPAWRISRFFELYELIRGPRHPIPPAPDSLAEPDRLPVPEGIREVCPDPIRTAIRLRPYPDPEVHVATSHMGGRFLANDPSQWPCCDDHNSPMIGVVQLLKEDFPMLPFRGPEEVLQVLWCPYDHPDAYCPWVTLRWLTTQESSDTNRPNPTTRHSIASHTPLPCRLFPHQVTELPALNIDTWDVEAKRAVDWLQKCPNFELPDRHAWDPDDHNEHLYGLVGPAPGTKLFGYADWIQDKKIPVCDHCKQPMLLMLTVASAEWCKDDGFKPTELNDQASSSITGLMLGDVGNIYVFICADCDERPIKRVFQCS